MSKRYPPWDSEELIYYRAFESFIEVVWLGSSADDERRDRKPAGSLGHSALLIPGLLGSAVKD